MAQANRSSKDNIGNVGPVADSHGEFAYLPPPAPFYEQEGLKEKLIRKTKENPFVPLGVIFTTVVLAIGVSTMRSGDGRKAQLMMRLRVGGQAFAVLALLAGVYHKTNSEKQDN
ncbi:HIG1 domain family member 2A [Biomphalaria glabrata]|uniref:HIG1 domain-containing protein n=2 Tax=Biomphalaria TaxID=6525 RepID=A0A2C9KYC7_BIOGL|nr:HIG1 domain family member 2A-like [Biomphalaria glabrata]KAI8789392.1 HIG1 domain family member 2A [Biomphalaria glabrata]KAK0057633.1 HIG1 domain family member 2A [Biomphalaria pfeifferi]